MVSKSKNAGETPKFELLDKLGSGLFADVVRARDATLNRFVALKIIKATRFRSAAPFLVRYLFSSEVY